MKGSGCLALAARIIGAAICLLVWTGRAAGQSDEIAGEYVCTEAHVAGKAVPCKVAPLSLRGDGKFELQGREGDYLVRGQWVELKGSMIKSRAQIESGHRIVFRFYNKRGLCEVIYERRVAELGDTQLG